MNEMFDNHYIDWRKKRFDFIINYYGKDYFNNKTILELGSGYGDLGAMFIDYGAKVTSVDARQEHIKYLSKIIKNDLIFETECCNSIFNISIENKENKENMISHLLEMEINHQDCI